MCDKCKNTSKLKCDASNKRRDYDSDKMKQFAEITGMLSLNESLQLIGESPIRKRRVSIIQAKFKKLIKL